MREDVTVDELVAEEAGVLVVVELAVDVTEVVLVAALDLVALELIVPVLLAEEDLLALGLPVALEVNVLELVASSTNRRRPFIASCCCCCSCS